MTDLAALQADVLAFAEFAGVSLYDWQREAFAQACQRTGGRFRYRLAAVSVPRGNGKSYAAAVVGLWRMLTGPPPQDVLSVALDYDGAKVVLDHARSILRRCPSLADVVEERAGGFLVPSTGSRLEVKPAEHSSSRGRHATLAVYDECGWARDDELFSSLLAGQASVQDPLMIVCSTVGRRMAGPLWTVKQLAEHGDQDVLWWHSSRNPSPLVTDAFLARQRRILVAAQYHREHENQWIDAADSFVSAEDVDRSMSQGWRERHEGRADETFHGFLDLGLVHDPSVLCIGHVDPQDGRTYVDVLSTWQGSKRRPVEIASIETALVDLSRRFKITRLRIESWQGVSTAQRLEAIGLPVEVFAPTPKAHQDEWPTLAHALSEGRLVLPRHDRLREELLGLTVEVGPTGAKVTDRGKIHQDHAVAVRGVVASLAGVLAAEPICTTDFRHVSPGILAIWDAANPDGDW